MQKIAVTAFLFTLIKNSLKKNPNFLGLTMVKNPFNFGLSCIVKIVKEKADNVFARIISFFRETAVAD